MADERGQGDAGDSTFELLERLKRTSSSDGPSSARRYEVLEEIARGGMGVVFRVRDLDLRRSLAMKVLSDRAEGDPGATELDSQRAGRFLEEAQVTGQLEHPGIIPVHEMGLDEQGRLFFTMRLVKGITLREVFEHARAGREGWSITRALGVVLKVCEAMAFAHDKDVIHRDLKPANVMVGRFGETYVMDWGLAKLLGETDEPAAAASMQSILTSSRKKEATRDGDSSMETLEGDVMGTPAYMPPEQARGELARMGPHSDVYSVGAMLYHLIAGHAPYSESGEQRPPHEILLELLERPPASLERVARDVSPELIAICDKAMAREPGERYASMLAMAEDLHAYLDNRVVQAHRTGAVVEFRKWVARNRGIAASLAFALFVAIAGLASVGWVQARGREELASKNDELRLANRELESARSETEKARDEALANAQLARANEELARAQEVETRWQSYVANIHAATAMLINGSAHEARARLEAADESLRDWEWRFLWNQSDTSLQTIAGPLVFSFASAISPDGKFAASGGGQIGGTGTADFRVRLFDIEGGEIVRVLDGHTNNVQSVDFSPPGTELVTSGIDGTVRLWDVASGEEVARLDAFGGVAAYHPDGRHVVVAGTESQAGRDRPTEWGIWDTYEDRLVHTAVSPSLVQAVAVSPRGDRLALGCRDYGVRLIDWETRDVVQELDARGEHPDRPQRIWISGITTLAFDSTGTNLASGGTDGCARVWQQSWTGGYDLIAYLEGHQAAVFAAAFHPTERWLITADDGSLRFFDIESSEELETLHGHSAPIMAVDVTEDGERVLTSGADTTIRLWDGSPGSSAFAFTGASGGDNGSFAMAFSADGTRLAWAAEDHRIEIRDARSGERRLALAVSLEPYRDAFFRADDTELVTLDRSGGVRVWDADTGELLRREDLDAQVHRTAVSPDRRTAALSLLGPARVSIFDVESMEEVGRLEGFRRLGNVAFASDGRRLLVEEGGGVVGIWDATTQERVGEFQDAGELHAMVAVPGTDLVAVSLFNVWDQELRLWNVETGELVRKLRAHGEPTAVAASPDGRRLLTGCWDNSVILFDLERGEVLALSGHGSPTGHVAFAPSGDRIASHSFDGTFRLWDASSPAERAEPRLAAASNRRWREAARKIVDELEEEYLTREGRRAALDTRDDLDTRVVRAARQLLAVDAPHWSVLGPAALAVAREPDRVPDDYLRALAAAEKAVRLWPEIGDLHGVLGACQYRMGRYAEALNSLRTAGSANGPAGLAFTTMALAKVGMTPMAERTLDTLFGVFEQLDEAEQASLAPLLDEAEQALR